MAKQGEKDSADVITVARTIYNEARGDGLAGMQGVAEVIRNRIGHAGYGKKSSAIEVVSQQGQFLGYGTSVPKATGVDATRWEDAKNLARNLVDGTLTGNKTCGAHAFHKAESSKGLVGPAWTATHTVKIGEHNFFKITPAPKPAKK